MFGNVLFSVVVTVTFTKFDERRDANTSDHLYIEGIDDQNERYSFHAYGRTAKNLNGYIRIHNKYRININKQNLICGAHGM